jgi:adenylate kinase family enzyme
MADYRNGKRVIIISGPAGSGKTTTALLIARHENWTLLSEDEEWVRLKKGHPVGEARTEAEQAIVQARTMERIYEELSRGNNVVVEFILYQSPPQPVIFYREELLRRDVAVITRLLKPSEDAIMERKIKRGRAHDQNETVERTHARHQLACLDSLYFQKDWIIDTTDDGEDDVFDKHFRKLVDADFTSVWASM